MGAYARIREQARTEQPIASLIPVPRHGAPSSSRQPHVGDSRDTMELRGLAAFQLFLEIFAPPERLGTHRGSKLSICWMISSLAEIPCRRPMRLQIARGDDGGQHLKGVL